MRFLLSLHSSNEGASPSADMNPSAKFHAPPQRTEISGYTVEQERINAGTSTTMALMQSALNLHQNNTDKFQRRFIKIGIKRKKSHFRTNISKQYGDRDSK